MGKPAFHFFWVALKVGLVDGIEAENRPGVMEIPSVDAAMALPPGALFRAIQQAAGHDQDTVDHAREALRRKNPTLEMTLHVDDTAEWFTADDIAITVTGSSAATTPVQSLTNGQSGTFTLRFAQILDAGSVGPGSSLEFSARDTGLLSNDPGTLHWAFPFHDASSPIPMIAPDGTDYRLAAIWRD